MVSWQHRIGRQTRLFSLITAVIVIVSIFITQPAFARATQTESQSKSEDLSIINSTPLIVGPSAITVAFTTTASSGTVHFDLIRPTNTRSQLFDFTESPDDARVRDSVSYDLSTMTYNAETDVYSTTIPVNNEPENSLSFALTGIYPLAVSIEDVSKRVTDFEYTFVTYVPSVSENGSAFSQRLGFAPIVTYSPFINRLDLDEDATRLSEYGKEVQSSLFTAQETINRINTKGVPATFFISPELLETVGIIDSLDNEPLTPFITPSAGPSVQYLLDTYVPSNIAEIDERYNAQDASFLFDEATRIGNTNNIVAESSVAKTDGISPNSLSILSQQKITRAITPEDNFPSNLRPKFRPVTLSENDTDIDVATLNTSIMKNLPKDFSDAAQANYLLAALGVVALESPSLSRGFLMELDLAQLSGRTIDLTFAGLNNALVEPITLDQYFDRYQVDESLSQRINRSDYPSKIQQPYSETELKNIARTASASGSMYEDGTLHFEQSQWMNNVTFSSSTRNVRSVITEKSAQAFLERVLDYIALPEERTLTLTSRENTIPITIRNSSDIDISVVIEMSSDRLDFPEGNRFAMLLNEENNTVQIPVRARTTGSFQVSVSVVTPRESVAVAEDSLIVRSTAFFGAGLAIAALSLLFLAVWWISHYKKSRKKPLAEVVSLGTDKN
jgi:hypothetical protein